MSGDTANCPERTSSGRAGERAESDDLAEAGWLLLCACDRPCEGGPARRLPPSLGLRLVDSLPRLRSPLLERSRRNCRFSACTSLLVGAKGFGIAAPVDLLWREMSSPSRGNEFLKAAVPPGERDALPEPSSLSSSSALLLRPRDRGVPPALAPVLRGRSGSSLLRPRLHRRCSSLVLLRPALPPHLITSCRWTAHRVADLIRASRERCAACAACAVMLSIDKSSMVSPRGARACELAPGPSSNYKVQERAN
mmetsp:Transcript_67485/g.190236  ORF Transcript_67485/g.190236 Transcript_67485/m.190236 type:complete len:252 (+) Transcript_67485:832-1587(+)